MFTQLFKLPRLNKARCGSDPPNGSVAPGMVRSGNTLDLQARNNIQQTCHQRAFQESCKTCSVLWISAPVNVGIDHHLPAPTQCWSASPQLFQQHRTIGTQRNTILNAGIYLPSLIIRLCISCWPFVSQLCLPLILEPEYQPIACCRAL